MSSYKRAVVAMLISTLGFSLMGLFVKLTGDIPVAQKTLFRTIIGTAIAYATLRRMHIPLSGIRHWKLLTLRSVLGTIGILINYYALDHLILSDADVIFRLNVIFVMLLSWIFLGERMTRVQLTASVVAFLGLILIIKPAFSVRFIPYLIALGGSVAAGGAYTLVRKLGQKEHPAVVVFFFSAFTTVVLLPYVALHFEPMSGIQWMYAILSGVMASVGQFGITIAYKLAPASEISIFSYLGVVFATVFSILFFDRFPDIWSLIGYGIVFGSIFILYQYNKKRAIHPSERH